MRRRQRKADTLALQRELDRAIGQRDTARQDIATLTEALAHALAAVTAATRETAAVEERADRLGELLEWEHAANRTLRAEVDALDRWAKWSPAQILAVCSDAEHWRNHRCQQGPNFVHDDDEDTVASWDAKVVLALGDTVRPWDLRDAQTDSGTATHG